jgi:DNA-binding MarR family transcriptional regulator
MALVVHAIGKASSAGALFGQALAQRLGLAPIDVECLDVLNDEGGMAIGRLSELTGLTTGSATRMVDRLEQAGYVRRVPDPADRRRVQVELVPGIDQKWAALHAPLTGAQRDLVSSYKDDQLTLLADFLDRSADVARREVARMHTPGDETGEGGGFAAPVGGVTSGRLVFISGAPRISVRGDTALKELCRARFEGPVPRMRVRDGVVTVSYPRFGWFDWRAQVAGQSIDASAHRRKDQGEIALNPAIPWAVELRGGVSKLIVDARVLRLQSFDLHGGASQVDLMLPVPVGVVPIRVEGGMNNIELERPAGVAMVLELRGGVNQAIVDGETHKGTGRLSLQTPGADKAADRYEIELSGGISKVVVTTR